MEFIKETFKEVTNMEKEFISLKMVIDTKVITLKTKGKVRVLY